MGNYFVDFYGELVYGFTGLFTNYVVAILVPVMFDDIEARRCKSWAKLALHMLLCAVASQLLCAAHYALFGQAAMSQVCGGLVTMLYAVIFVRLPVSARITITLTYFAVIASALVVCFSAADLMGSTDGEMYIVFFLICVLLAGCALYIRTFTVRDTRVPAICTVLVCAASAGNIAFWIITNTTTLSASSQILIGIMLIVLLLMAYYSAYVLTNNIVERQKKRMETIMRNTDEKMLRMSEANLDSMRRLRHELKNQYAYMRVLLENKEYAKLEKYFAEYSDNVENTLSFIDCGNHTISAVLNIGADRAARMGIRFIHKEVVPRTLPFTDFDLCSLMLNLINNALEYLQRAGMAEDGYVAVSVETINKTTVVTVSNPVREEDGARALQLRTDKRHAAEHGLGTKIVRSIVDRYDGGVTYEVKDGKFTVCAMLSAPDSAQKTAGGGKEKMADIRVAICDDDDNIIDLMLSAVRTAFSRHGVTAEIETFGSAGALARGMALRIFDLLFLDIEMPGSDGISFGERLRKSDDKTEIVYVSAREDRVFDALKVRPFDFVRKSNFLGDLDRVINNYVKTMGEKERATVTVRSKIGIVNVPLERVTYIEGSGKYQLMHVEGKSEPVQVYSAMEKLEEELAPLGFIRIHKGILVNYRAISRLSVGTAELTNGEILPMSRRKTTEIKERYMALLRGNGSVLL